LLRNAHNIHYINDSLMQEFSLGQARMSLQVATGMT